MLKYHISLQDRGIGHQSGPAIIGAGGKMLVCPAGTQARATLVDINGAALSNPIALVRGAATFYVANNAANAAMDLFVLTGEGFSVQLWSVGPDEINEVPIDRDRRHGMLILPFSIADQVSDATAVNSGFTLVVGMVFLPFPFIKVVTADAGKTVDIGVAGTENGIISALSLTTLGLVKDVDGSLINAITTYLATAIALDWTLSTGSSTGTGYIFLPYMLMNTGTPIITQS